jgi:transcriptional regulator GlxA family with amidase domain
LRDRLCLTRPEIKRPSDPFQARLVEVLGENFMDAEFGVAELAEAVHLDRSQLFRKLKGSSGLSPSKYIQNFRLDRAAELLESGACTSVSQVAYACGFNSLSWFSKCFRERFGTRPADRLSSDP